jgi:hypothetical protein
MPKWYFLDNALLWTEIGKIIERNWLNEMISNLVEGSYICRIMP